MAENSIAIEKKYINKKQFVYVPDLLNSTNMPTAKVASTGKHIVAYCLLVLFF